MSGWTLDGDMNAMNLDVVSPLGRIAMIDCENDELTDAQLMANAKLIAAAPRLKTALDALVVNYAQSGRVTDHFVRDVAALLQEIEA